MSQNVESVMRGVKAQSAQKMQAYRLGGPSAVDQLNVVPGFVNNYSRDILLGLIDGTTTAFNTDCQTGMKGSVTSAFNLATYGLTFYQPSSLVKTQMSVNDVMTAVNSVTAYCNFTLMLNQFSALLNYTDYAKYVQLLATAGGSFIAAVPQKLQCIRESSAGQDGYGVGLCSGNIFTMILDLKL